MRSVTAFACVAWLLVACHSPDNPALAADSGRPDWTPRQRQAFEQFRSGKAADRFRAAPVVTDAFPIAFDYTRLRVIRVERPLASRQELLKLLGPPTTQFTLADDPDFLGTRGRQLEFDPAEALIYQYDVDCFTDGSSAVEERMCLVLDVVSLRDTVLRLTLNLDYRHAWREHFQRRR